MEADASIVIATAVVVTVQSTCTGLFMLVPMIRTILIGMATGLVAKQAISALEPSLIRPPYCYIYRELHHPPIF